MRALSRMSRRIDQGWRAIIRASAIRAAAVGLALLAPVAPARADAPLSFTSVGEQGRFQDRDGKPLFVLGVYDTGVGPFASVDEAETILFKTGGDLRNTRALDDLPALNVYLNYHRGHDSTTQLWSLMGALQTRKVLWLQTANCHADGSYSRYDPDFSVDQEGFLDELFTGTGKASTGQLAGYYIMDECDDTLIPETQEHHRLLTEKHEKLGVPLPVNLAVTWAAPDREPGFWTRPALNCNPRSMVPAECEDTWTPTASLFGTDPYPLFGRELRTGYGHFLVADYVARLRHWVPASDPILAVLQLFKFGGGGRLPTYGEMRMHAYSAITEGAQGLFWWEIGVNGLRSTQNRDPEIRRMLGYLRDLTNELKGVRGGLLAAADPGLGGLAAGCGDTETMKRDAAIQWRKTAVERNRKLIGRYSYATFLWYGEELTALNSGSLARSPMLHDATRKEHNAVRADVQCSDVRTRASFDDVAKRGYLIAYNYSNTTTKADFVWNHPAQAITVTTDGGSSNVKFNGTGPVLFSDTLGPYESRVYVITP